MRFILKRSENRSLKMKKSRNWRLKFVRGIVERETLVKAPTDLYRCRQKLSNRDCFKDLINEGNLGLIRAARRFDEKISNSSLMRSGDSPGYTQALAEQSRIIKLPSAGGNYSQIGKMQSKLSKFRRLPNVEESC